MAGARWLRRGSRGVLGKGEGRRKRSNHGSYIAPKNQMENKLISHWLSQTPKERIEGGKPPSAPPLEAPMQRGLLRVPSKARCSVCQLCAGCRALQCSREKFTAHGQCLNKCLCQLCPLPSLAPNREFASSHLKPRMSPAGSHQGGSFVVCAGAAGL